MLEDIGLDVKELIHKLKDWMRDEVDIYWSVEEARELGYRTLKLHTIREHELSLILHISDYESGELKVLGVRLLVDKSKIEKRSLGVLKRNIDFLASRNKTSYAESSSYIQFLYRSSNLDESLKVISTLLEVLKRLKANPLSSNKFIGYSFLEEEVSCV